MIHWDSMKVLPEMTYRPLENLTREPRGIKSNYFGGGFRIIKRLI